MRTLFLNATKKLSRLLLFVFGLSFAFLGFPSLVSAQADIFGKISAPAGVDKYNAKAGVGGIGLILFVSNLIRLTTVVAGIWVFINFIMAGWIYITSSGDASAHAKVSSKMTMSIMGLMIIVGAYTIAALLGLIIFGDASYILNPKLKGIQ